MRSIKNKICALSVVLAMLAALLAGCANERTNLSTKILNGESLEVHFIDVGQADATLVMCGGENMLIDGGNVGDSSLIYSYLREHNVAHLDYMIATHAHEDHIGGLAGALNYADVGTVYSPVKTFDTETFGDFKKYVEAQGKRIEIPAAGTTFTLGAATCEILGVNTLDNDPNNTSIVMRIDYGETSFLLCGDAEKDVEEILLASGADVDCTVLKVPHHGSDSSLSDVWLFMASPEYAVISVGADNDYGHPNERVLTSLIGAGVEIYRTDQMGHIICTSDGKKVSFESEQPGSVSSGTYGNSEKNKSQNVYEDNGTYVLNLNSMKFHYPACSSVGKMSEKNKQIVDWSREELMEKGYAPCGSCNP